MWILDFVMVALAITVVALVMKLTGRPKSGTNAAILKKINKKSFWKKLCK